jgi:hypothetical protein
MEIALSAASVACSHVSDIARRSEKKVSGKKEELRREVIPALLAMNLSQGKEVQRTKEGKKRTLEKRGRQLRGRIRRKNEESEKTN